MEYFAMICLPAISIMIKVSGLLVRRAKARCARTMSRAARLGEIDDLKAGQGSAGGQHFPPSGSQCLMGSIKRGFVEPQRTLPRDAQSFADPFGSERQMMVVVGRGRRRFRRAQLFLRFTICAFRLREDRLVENALSRSNRSEHEQACELRCGVPQRLKARSRFKNIGRRPIVESGTGANAWKPPTSLVRLPSATPSCSDRILRPLSVFSYDGAARRGSTRGLGSAAELKSRISGFDVRPISFM